MTSSSEDRAVLAYVGLGSNLESPAGQILRALEALARIRATRLVGRSSLYRTAPVGFLDQPDFVNAVAALETTLAPRTLLAELLAIERIHGRVRTVADGPRTLDLDLLLYGEDHIQSPELVVPHPRMLGRGFVLAPLAEIAPGLRIGSGEPLPERAARLAAEQRVERMRPDALA